jgi:L-fuconolactonase
MRIVDTQVHAAHLHREEAIEPGARFAAAAEALLAAMDAVGVDHAVIAPRFDAELGAAAVALHPDRLSRVAMIDPDAGNLEAQVEDAKRMPGVVALRQVVADYAGDRGVADLRDGKFARLFRAAEREDLPLFLLGPGFPAEMAEIAIAHPRLTLIIDHFGLRQYPPLKPDAPPLGKLPGLLSLAKFPNVLVKMCGAQLFSALPYPHADIWDWLRGVVDAFGAERMLWASDFTRLRMVPPGEPWRGTYGEALGVVRDTDALSAEEKALILGGNAARVLGI